MRHREKPARSFPCRLFVDGLALSSPSLTLVTLPSNITTAQCTGPSVSPRGGDLTIGEAKTAPPPPLPGPGPAPTSLPRLPAFQHSIPPSHLDLPARLRARARAIGQLGNWAVQATSERNPSGPCSSPNFSQSLPPPAPALRRRGPNSQLPLPLPPSLALRLNAGASHRLLLHRFPSPEETSSPICMDGPAGPSDVDELPARRRRAEKPARGCSL